jgi:alpha-beta hydrolase superfamily lysophospholipase
MRTERFEIKNRHGLKLVIQVDTPDNPTNLVFIAHGKSGFIEQVHISAFADVFVMNGFIAIRFDATNSLGESEGETINATYTSYLEDLEDVINWAKEQNWFMQPFALCGHSMGAQTTAWYAEHHPSDVKLLCPMAPTINYELYSNSKDGEVLQEWEHLGYQETSTRSRPGVHRYGWELANSLKLYDLLPLASRLTMPVINIVGEQDSPCPPVNQRIFMDALASKNKKLIVIPGAEHSYRNNDTGEYGPELEDVKSALSSWLKDIQSL